MYFYLVKTQNLLFFIVQNFKVQFDNNPTFIIK